MAVAAAASGVEFTCAPREFPKVGARLLKLGDALLDLVESMVDELADVLAGRFAAVADVEDLADLAQRETGVSASRMKTTRSSASGG